MLFAFSIIIVLVIGLGIYNFSVVQKSNEEARSIVERELPLLMANEQMAASMAHRIATARGYILFGADYKEQFDAYTEIGKQNEEIVREIGATPEFEELISQTVAWREDIETNVFAEYDRGNEALAIQNMDASSGVVREIIMGYERLASESRERIVATEATIISNGESTLRIVVIVTVLVILVSITAALITSNLISKSIQQVKDRMNLIASGDLSEEPLQSNSEDEVGQLVTATNDLNAQLSGIVRNTLSISNEVYEKSGLLTESTGTVSDSSNQIAATMEQLAAGAEAQAHTATNMAETVGNFFEDVQHVNARGSEVATASSTVLERTAEGNEMMTSSVEQMNAIFEIVNEAVTSIQTLDSEAKEISSLVTVISEIAEQTNLLALNAAIEAARAGEEGKGFAVVAEEVKKLAEQVATSVNEITTIVDNVQVGSSNAVKALETGYNHVSDGQQKIEDTGRIFEEITTLVGNMNELTNAMSEDLSNIETIGGQLTGNVTEVASIAEESAAGVEETTASVEQATFQIEQISQGADELERLSRDLESTVNQFTVEK